MTHTQKKCLQNSVKFIAILHYSKYKSKTFFCLNSRNKTGIVLIVRYAFINFIFFKSIILYILYGLYLDISGEFFVILLISRSISDGTFSFSLFIRSYYISDDG